MAEFNYKEKAFEDAIESDLITTGGYKKGDPAKFDRAIALDKDTFVNFIKTSQPKEWVRFEKIYSDLKFPTLKV